MIQLDTGNVLLKPSHRRQLMAWMKRATKMGERLGDMALRIVLTRSGRGIEATARVGHKQQAIIFKSRASDWRDAVRDIIKSVAMHFHGQLLNNRRMTMG